MIKGYIELDLDKMEEECVGFLQPELVNKASIMVSQFCASSLLGQLQNFTKHNISSFVKRIESEMNHTKISIENLSNYVHEVSDNYSRLDSFLLTSMGGSTTSSLANSVIGSVPHLDSFGIDFEIPNSRVKLDYQPKFHSIVREESLLFSELQKGNTIKEDEVETL